MPKFNSNQIIDKVIRYGDKLTGHSKRKLENAAHVLNNAHSMGIPGINRGSILAAQRLAEQEGKEVLRTRVKTGLGVVGGGTAGFLGLHKYHQHRDNKILERIDNMYKTR